MQIVNKEFIDNLTPVSSSKMRKEAIELINKLTKMPIGSNFFIKTSDWTSVKYRTRFRAWFSGLNNRVKSGKNPNPLLERLFDGYEYRVSTYEEGWVITKIKD